MDILSSIRTLSCTRTLILTRAAMTLLLCGWIIGTCSTLASLASGQEATEEVRTFDDFDSVALGDRWIMAGGERATAARVAVPDGTQAPGVAGQMATIGFIPGSVFAMKNDIAWPELNDAGIVRLRVRAADASAADPEKIEVRVYSRERMAWRWRRIDLVDTRWRTVDLPMRLFLHSEGTHVAWDEAQRLAIFSRTEGEIDIDQIELVADREQPQSELTAAELAELAFGARGSVYQRAPFALITDCDDLDHAAVLDALESLQSAVDQKLGPDPDPSASSSLIPLLVFQQAEDYQRFFDTLGTALQAQVAKPRTQGYTVFGIACCVRSDEFGAVRPIYVHETCHALLERRLGLANRNEWLHEGLASHFQSTLLQQDEDRQRAAAAVIAQPTEWSKLLSGEAIGLEEYASAMFVIEWLLADSARKEKFLEAFSVMKRNRSTKFDSALPELLNTSPEVAVESWLEFVKSQTLE